MKFHRGAVTLAVNPPGRIYRCLYCRREFRESLGMLRHEWECPMRATVDRLWQMRIEKARRLEMDTP